MFVAATLPGETVRADVSGKRGVLLDVVTASAERVPAPCPNFPACGGCRVQHWAAAAYAVWKRSLLTEAVARAGYAPGCVGALVATPPGARRRAEFSLRRGPDGVAVGFHSAGSVEIVDLSVCLVLRPAIVGLLPALRTLGRSLTALKRDGSALVNDTDTGPCVLLRTDGALNAADRRTIVAFAERADVARVSWVDGDVAETIIERRVPVVRFGDAGVRVPPGAFLQASAEGEAAIVAAVLAGLSGLAAKALVADLYAGCGTLSLPVAARARVVAYETDAGSVAALRAAAPPGRLTVERRDLVRQPSRAEELARVDAVVLDPPHAGAGPQVAEIARSGVRRLVYVTCNPATFERDARALREAGFALTRATPIDQFLWSARLEAVAVFERTRPARRRPGLG